MNANIVLSVKGRKVLFNPHAALLKWKILFPIERIEIKCENSHHFECVGYVPATYQKEMYIVVECDKWDLPTCEKVVLPLMNDIPLTYQIHDTLFNDCHTVISVPTSKIEQYMCYMRGARL